ncbi:uncharacterized protein MELLADRAFT_114123 [Melampsora larici-populina 98AG31]|uniref:Uncharacterized protein n=1 Tax=Melampsora larici-populina (strain 98AG31 / pathotype 3-4-7) TaxID=747676 RepID=F4SC90_MELLP|nr:uncharacterized protein MELLADRAFT_114123 [Melampsora larici-populina 98AG31]EGF97743.1 hypothetical protein MELLADRAFT_114123 [Melampsora larici-populina 98AG31]
MVFKFIEYLFFQSSLDYAVTWFEVLNQVAKIDLFNTSEVVVRCHELSMRGGEGDLIEDALMDELDEAEELEELRADRALMVDCRADLIEDALMDESDEAEAMEELRADRDLMVDCRADLRRALELMDTFPLTLPRT